MSPSRPDLATALANWRERSNMLRVTRAMITPDTLDQCLTDIARSAERFTRWLNETDAHLHSGRSLRWLRGEYTRLEAQGDARRGVGGKRFYRMAALPVALNVDALLGQAERDAADDGRAA